MNEGEKENNSSQPGSLIDCNTKSPTIAMTTRIQKVSDMHPASRKAGIKADQKCDDGIDDND
jgi:hypothetical protein